MQTKKYKIGYTQGVFDLFHIGHLNLLNNAKAQCDYLYVGVNADELVKEYKGIVPNINQQERLAIVENIKAVDKAFVATTLDKAEILKDVRFDAVFIGDDWKNNERWKNTQEQLKQFGVDVVFLPHTDGISSTILREKTKVDKK